MTRAGSELHVAPRPQLYLVPRPKTGQTPASLTPPTVAAYRRAQSMRMHPAGRLRESGPRPGVRPFDVISYGVPSLVESAVRPKASRPILLDAFDSPDNHRPTQRVPVRLTHRGRIVVRILMVLAIVLAVLAITAATQAATNSEGSPGSVVVAPGDTVWSIASQHAGSAGVRATVNDIVRLNDLDGVHVETGQRIRLP